tara:strand:- start:3 stop:515 length:513 start_codon:yes stop_codon:yes gene_type:complete
MAIKKNLVLLGMMGVGKSTTGKYVAKKLKINFFDVDRLIEKNNNMKIAQIFEQKGEKYFRKNEEFFSLKYLDKKKSVISLGGGAFINNKIRNKVLSNCVSIWLNLSLENLYKRLKNNKKRPMINKNDPENIKKLFEERKKIYCLANYEINCDNLTINELSEKIIKLYENV